MIETIKEDNSETGSAILLVGMLYLCEVRKLFETLSERDISGNYIVRNKGRPLVEQCGGEGWVCRVAPAPLDSEYFFFREIQRQQNGDDLGEREMPSVRSDLDVPSLG